MSERLFELEMAGVKPLKSNSKPANLQALGKKIDPSLERRRQAAEDRVPNDPNYLTLGEVDTIAPHDPIGFCRPGMQHGVYRNLRLGHYRSEATLSLTQLGFKACRKELYEFIKEVRRMEIRTVVIRHGQGLQSNPVGWRKSYVNAWLQQIPEVMAFHSTQPQHGGTSAVYVLLQKGSEAKRANRERFGKRG